MTSIEHPNDLDLELARTGEAAPEVVAHLAGCQTCQQRQEMFVQLAEELAPAPVSVPAARDAAIVGLLAPPTSPRKRFRRYQWLWAAPAAAAAALVIFLAYPMFHHGRSPLQLAAAPDVNADGVVNIVDAMLLAQAMGKDRNRGDWDVDGNHRVDEADVDAIALAAVSLGGRR